MALAVGTYLSWLVYHNGELSDTIHLYLHTQLCGVD
jgi:hypothetical protein